MAKSMKDRLLERLPGTRTASDEGRGGPSVGFAQKVSGFLQEFRTEMKKVTWPGRKDTASSTAVVIVTVLIIVAFLGLVDFALGKIVHSVLSY
ncbi:MAG: preprotein translocase subunit SecE [Deltaproteobacteria bacterium]|nr:MAG: preprotein translocase subunit SecE [Deltaproteobacteria bacterium]